MVPGCFRLHSPQRVVTIGSDSSLRPEPASSPMTGSPSSVDHRLLVSWSNMSLFDRYNSPLVPKVRCWFPTTLWYGIAVPHSVQ